MHDHYFSSNPQRKSSTALMAWSSLVKLRHSTSHECCMVRPRSDMMHSTVTDSASQPDVAKNPVTMYVWFSSPRWSDPSTSLAAPLPSPHPCPQPSPGTAVDVAPRQYRKKVKSPAPCMLMVQRLSGLLQVPPFPAVFDSLKHMLAPAAL